MMAIDIDKKLDSFNNLISELGVTVFATRDVWQRQNEIAENFKANQFTAEDTARFEQLTALLQTKETELENLNEIFCSEAEGLVHELEKKYAEFSTTATISKDDFKQLRELIHKTFEYFKHQRWTSKERRITAWDKYNATRNVIKDKEDELYSKEKEDRAKLLSQSLEITEKLCVVVNACHPENAIEELLQMVQKFNGFLIENTALQNEQPWHLIAKPDDIKYSLRCRTQTLNDIRNFINTNKDALTREHKGQIFANMDALKNDLNKAWEMHKEEMEVKKKERDEKRIEWNKKQQEFLVFMEKRLENQIAFKAKQDGYMQNQKEHAARMEARILQQHDYIDKLKEQIVDLEKKHATAWTDTFKQKVEEWMKEKKDKIAVVEKEIEQQKAKIADINKTIEEQPLRSQELEASIEEITNKITEVKEKLAADVLTDAAQQEG